MTTLKPMLASVFDENKLTFPKLASRKLDGIRCYVDNGVAYSRNGKPIRNEFIQSILGDPELNGLDGELMVGNPNDDKAFRNATSGVMSFDGESDFTFYVFDNFTVDEPFSIRLREAERQVANFDHPRVVICEHVELNSLDELAELEAHFLMDGYEGVMLRCPNGPYKQGRSSTREGYLLKVKRFSDDEAVVIDSVEEKDKYGDPKGSLGKLICVTSDGIQFGCGGGFTKEEREELWKDRPSLIGRIVKYKYFAIGMKDAPRFPVFLGFRDAADMDAEESFNV